MQVQPVPRQIWQRLGHEACQGAVLAGTALDKTLEQKQLIRAGERVAVVDVELDLGGPHLVNHRRELEIRLATGFLNLGDDGRELL